MDRFLWPKSSRDRASRQHDLSRSITDPRNDHVFSEHIEKKKKVVSDLMALRRMKLKQNSRIKSPLMLELKGPVNDVTKKLQPEDVQPFLENTYLKEELDKVYGKDALLKATEHFSDLALIAERPSSIEDQTERKRYQFLGNIVEKKRENFEKGRQQRLRKQQKLVGDQIQLTQKSLSSESYSGDLPSLVKETEQKIGAMEENLRALKKKYARDISLITTERLNKAFFESFKAEHSEEIAVVFPIIEDLLEKVSKQAAVQESNAADSKLLEMLLKADKQQYEELQEHIMSADLTLAAMEEIIDDTYPELVKELCAECIFLSQMTLVYPDDVIVNSSIASSGKGGKAKKVSAKLVNESYLSILSNRETFRTGLWNHTQLTIKEDVKILSDAPVATKAEPVLRPVIDTGADSEEISSETAVPKLDSKFGRSMQMKVYSTWESDVWKGYSPDGPEFSVSPNPVMGISITCQTSDHSLLAVGSNRGDILVYNMFWQPFRLVRNVVFRRKANDAIVSMHWSLDNTRLVTLSSEGCVIVWSVAFVPHVSTNDTKLLDLSQSSYNSQQLTALSVIEATKGDFRFQEGSLSESTKEISLPSLVSFHPTLSIAATQDSIVVALHNGDILKCNLSKNIQNRCRNSIIPEVQPHNHEKPCILGVSSVKTEKVLKIGLDIETELFRFHKYKLLQICFVNNGGDMISLDSGLNLCQWKHDSAHLNTFGWFTPFKKFTLSFVEEVLTAKNEDEVIFEDVITLKKAAKGKKTKSKQVIETERRRALREMQNARLAEQQPWFTDEFPDEIDTKLNKGKKPPKFITRVYAPPDDQIIDASAGGATFTVVTLKREGGLLVKFAFRRYESSMNTAITLLQSNVAVSGDRMYFMLLFDEHLPKTRKHISFVDFDFETMQLGKLGPLQVKLTSENFSKCNEGNATSFSLSRVQQSSGTEYIVTNICGDLAVYSLLSGRKVLQRAAEKETLEVDCLELPPKFSKLKVGSRVLYVKPDGETSYIVVLPLVYNKSGLNNRVLRIYEATTPQKRLSLQLAYKSLASVKNQFTNSVGEPAEIGWFKSEQVCLREIWTHRSMPISLYMQLMINTIIDVALARATGVRMPQDTRKNVWKKDWLNMSKYFS